jgi:hypothetical protein
MPSVSAKQARLMAAAAHDPAIAKSAGVPQSVAREFTEADRKRKRGLEALADAYGSAGKPGGPFKR